QAGNPQRAPDLMVDNNSERGPGYRSCGCFALQVGSHHYERKHDAGKFPSRFIASLDQCQWNGVLGWIEAGCNWVGRHMHGAEPSDVSNMDVDVTGSRPTRFAQAGADGSCA